VGSNNYRDSFVLQEHEIVPFIDALEKNPSWNESTITSQFQKLNGDLEGFHLILYHSGIVICESVMHDKLRNILQTIGYEVSKKKQEEDNKAEGTQGWSSIPKSIWLNQMQRKQLVQLLNQDTASHRLPGLGDNEEFRYAKNKQILVFNKNGTIYTIDGYDGLLELVEKTITLRPLYPNFENIFGFDITGLKSPIGPIVICCIRLTRSEMMQLQLSGVKHSWIGRTRSRIPLARKIHEITKKISVKQISPQSCNDLNNMDNNNSGIKKLIASIIQSSIEDLYHKTEKNQTAEKNTLFFIKQELWNVGEKILRQVIPEHSKILIGRDKDVDKVLASTTILLEAEMEKWLQEIQKEYNIIVQKTRIQELKNHQSSDKILRPVFSV
jgi:ribonuclease HIII